MASDDRLIGRILNVTLRLDGVDRAVRQQPVFLAELSQELVDEGAGDLLLRKEHMDRALMARLMLPPSPERQWPVHYLLDVYTRAGEELRAQHRDAAAGARMQDIAAFAQDLAVSHMHLALVINMFPQAPAAEARGPLQLLDAMDVASGSTGPTPPGTAALPSGFLERLAERYLDDGLAEIVRPIALQLGRQLLGLSLLGEVARPLGHLLRLASIPQVALTLTRLPEWAPPLSNGRELQTRTLLGPAFAVSAIPDIDIFFGRPSPLPPPQPDVAGTLFGHADASPSELAANMQCVRVAARGVRETLANLCMAFLRPQATREAMLTWLGLALEANREHDKEMPDVTVAAPRGLMLNLAAVLLHACKPFLDPASGKAWPRLDARYVRQGVRLNASHDTRLHMTAEEAAADTERQRSHAAAGTSGAPWQPHFICECYFLTARCLHLGFVKAFGFTQQLGMSVQDTQEQLEQLDHMLQLQQAGGNAMQLAMVQRQRDVTQAQLTRVRGHMHCIQAEALELDAADGALAFCRLTAVWLLREASPAFKAGQPLALPLAGPAPDAFRALPEHLVGDTVELLKLAPYFPEVHSALQALPSLEELVLFLTAFMPASAHINNIYLRAQLGEVLASLMPREGEEQEEAFPSRRRRPPRGDPLSQAVSLLLDTNPTVQRSLVPNLLRLFVEIERTGRQNQFYEKFNVRRDIGRILLLLWRRPVHRAAWLRTAEADADLHSRFNYFLETDATLHLDDALKLLQEERDFQQLPEAEQARGQGPRSRRVRSLNFHLHYATLMLLLLRLTTREVWRPWLQPAAAKRLAGTLDYFLKHLTGPERRKLRVKDPGNELRFEPKELLTQIAAIYTNLAARDEGGVLAEAIAADKRSFYPQMFPEAIRVLRDFSLLPEAELATLAALGQATAAAVGRLAAEDAAEAEAPEEFFDPIMSELMADPVTLPSGVNVERAIIERHMMSDPTDPFSRMPLMPEDLKPNPELRARIEAWRAEHGQR